MVATTVTVASHAALSVSDAPHTPQPADGADILQSCSHEQSPGTDCLPTDPADEALMTQSVHLVQQPICQPIPKVSIDTAL